MTEIGHRYVAANGLRMHIAEAGEGPLVLLLHGFPECWYSWRHQLTALAEAGFHAVAPDQRGYARTGGPQAVEDYALPHLAGDVVALLAALGAPAATVVGHDWGALVAWHTALARPDLVRGVVGLSVPPARRAPVPTLTAVREHFGPDFYQLYFQRPGVEAEFEQDPREVFRRVLYGISGDIPEVHPMTVPAGQRFLDSWPSPAVLPGWLTEADLDAYVAEFAESGFTGPLNWYRNIDRNWALTALWDGAPITPPALFLAGEKDPVISWQGTRDLDGAVRALAPNLRGVELYPGAGHWVQQERPEQVNAALVEFATSLVH
jgi:pimeloyl-ACP methyl ester carboxylesterase